MRDQETEFCSLKSPRRPGVKPAAIEAPRPHGIALERNAALKALMGRPSGPGRTLGAALHGLISTSMADGSRQWVT
ncbi:unnamed protein product [Boreogadus saida]